VETGAVIIKGVAEGSKIIFHTMNLLYQFKAILQQFAFFIYSGWFRYNAAERQLSTGKRPMAVSSERTTPLYPLVRAS
jgi:hypothetical protein